MAKSERVTNGEHKITNTHRLGIANRHFNHVLGLDLEERDIRCGIAANDFCIKQLSVKQGNLYLVCILDHMVVGQYITVRSIDNYAGASARNLARPAAIRETEETPKRLIGVGLIVAQGLSYTDIDYGGRRCLHQGSEARHRLSADGCWQCSAGAGRIQDKQG